MIEPARSVPPAPGVDTVAVLRDAVAARQRGKTRDAILIALFVASLFAGFPLVVVWLVLGFLASAVARVVSARYRTWVLIGVAIIAGLMFMTVFAGSGLVIGVLLGSRSTVGSGLGATLLIELLLAVAVLVVLALDETVVDQLTRERFRRSTFRADPYSTTGWERSARTIGLGGYSRQLNRVAEATASRQNSSDAALIVHRGWKPFVGSGRMLRDQLLSLPLEPADNNRTPDPFTASELDAALRESLQELRRSPSLSPGRRLTQLEVDEQVFLPADQLGHLAGTALADVLPDPRYAPADHIARSRARALADAPAEAARYYISFRIESWNRDIVTSSFLTTATDQRTLYLEWTNCALLPLKKHYYDIDRPSEVPSGLRALFGAVTLPVTLPARIGNLLHFYRRIPAHPQEFLADRHGAGKSLRELAADELAQNFFQEADVLRYLTLVEQGIFRALSQFLESRGYSISEVLQAASSRVSNNINITGGSFINSALGIGITSQNTTTPSNGVQPTAAAATGNQQFSWGRQ